MGEILHIGQMTTDRTGRAGALPQIAPINLGLPVRTLTVGPLSVGIVDAPHA